LKYFLVLLRAARDGKFVGHAFIVTAGAPVEIPCGIVSELSGAMTGCAVVPENAYALRLSCERHNRASTNWR